MYFLDEEIDSGSIELKITYGIFNIPVRTVTFDLCDIADKDCPLKEKDVSLSISDEIPGASPSVRNISTKDKIIMPYLLLYYIYRVIIRQRLKQQIKVEGN